MLDGDNHSTPMERNDAPDNELIEFKDKMKACYDRAFQATPGNLPEPTKNDGPMELTRYRSALDILGEDFLADAMKAQMIAQIEKADANSLSAAYKSGTKCCLAVMPQVNAESITGKLYRLEVDAKGLTYRYTSDPAYYFLNLPKEVQEQCSFKVPAYKSSLGPDDDERKELKRLFEQAWDNLKALLKQEKKAA
jgi:hypothetical protein